MDGDARYTILDPGCWIPDARYSIQGLQEHGPFHRGVLRVLSGHESFEKTKPISAVTAIPTVSEKQR